MLCLGNAYKKMRHVGSMANAATVTTTIASAVKNSFAVTMAKGGAGSMDYVLHLSRENDVER